MSIKRGRSLFWSSRKGISPLIATVLLIAFAVSIGAMIMSWGKNAVNSSGNDCDAVKLEVQEINGKPVFCYDTINQQIRIMVKNTGEIDVERLHLRIITSDYAIDEKPVDASRIISGGIIVKNIPYIHSGKFHVEIIPEIIASSKDKSCSNEALIVEDIPKCG
ncbi:MAG: archaellin/type IV pilin N-terminal domain-containing protein [Candidatus Woesearchaeota archaeon]